MRTTWWVALWGLVASLTTSAHAQVPNRARPNGGTVDADDLLGSELRAGRPRRAGTLRDLATRELQVTPERRMRLGDALPILFARCQGLSLAAPPRYANLYHFHGLESLMVRAG